MGKGRDKIKEKNNNKKGRISCCDKEGLKKGAWTDEEDKILVQFITENGHGAWRNLPKLAGLLRCGKSCRLRWTNYLRPDIRRGPFSQEEENTIIRLHQTLGNKWAAIASHLQGRTDNDIKNFWNSHLRKRFTATHHPDQPIESRHMAQWESVKLEAESRLSSKATLVNTPSNEKSECDYFLRIWNSQVGESFRNLNECTSGRAESSFHSPESQNSSLTKVESRDLVNNVDDFDDASDAMMQLLLDFPEGDNDMGFLQESPNDDVSASI